MRIDLAFLFADVLPEITYKRMLQHRKAKSFYFLCIFKISGENLYRNPGNYKGISKTIALILKAIAYKRQLHSFYNACGFKERTIAC